MIQHVVEVADAKGRKARIQINLDAKGRGTWLALDKGFFSLERGVVDTGTYPAYPLAWAALYGGDRVDNDKLVLHLDDFLSHTGVHRGGGEGWVYRRDHLIMDRGAIEWHII